MSMTLYGYFRSSTSYRVRIALALKGMAYDNVTVNLLAGEHRGAEYRAINPQGRVPALDHDGHILTQSLAVIEYLDDIGAGLPLVHGDALQKAYIRRLSQIIATDIHPVTNLNVLLYLTGNLGVDDDAKSEWYADFAIAGLTAFERTLEQEGRAGAFCCGDTVSMADLCLVPQMYNMRRFDLPLHDFPLCRTIEENCVQLPAFIAAAPESQADAPADLAPIHGPHGIMKKQ